MLNLYSFDSIHYSMAEYPYVLTQGRLKQFLSKIQTTGTPSKVTHKWLESIGYKSKNDRLFVGVLKFIDFADSNGTTTDHYRKFKSKATAAAVMSSAVKRSYADLYKTYPKAHAENAKTLLDWFATNTTVGEATRSNMVNTFQTLASLADFEKEVPPGAIPEDERAIEQVRKGIVLPARGALTLNINVQLELPATHDQDIYDKLFASLSKHLLRSEEE